MNKPKNRRYSSTAVGFPSVGTPEAVIINELNIGIRAPVRAHMHKENKMELKNMNIVITLPTNLIEEIISGRKRFEMRKSIPLHINLGEDGFFCVEKGTRNVICWCRIDGYQEFTVNDLYCFDVYANLSVSQDWVSKYMNGKKTFLWKIGKVIKFTKPLSLDRDLYVDRNPQSFAYTPLSYGESY